MALGSRFATIACVPQQQQQQQQQRLNHRHHQQSAHVGQWDKKLVGTDDDEDQYKPAPIPGPGRGFRRSTESAGKVVVNETIDERGISPAEEGINQRQNQEDELYNTGADVPSDSKSEIHQKKDVGCHGCEHCSESDENLKELHRENNSLRIRVRAVETIVDTLGKTREELSVTTEKNAKLEKAISNLQSRLHRVGCDTSVDLAEHEIFIPGPDRAFVNSLISENGRLQKELRKRGSSSDTKSKIINENLEQKDEDKEKQLHDLREQLQSKDARISDLEKLIHSSNNNQTSTILQLQESRLRTAQELKDVENMCSMLTAETKRLQKALDASQSECQQACRDLAQWKGQAKSLEKKVLVESSQKKMSTENEGSLTTADKLKIAEGQVEQLDKENSRLTDQLREVIGMNTRWQRYNEQRETYVLKLTKTNQHQQSKITVLEQQQRDLEQTINRLNTMLQNMKDGQRKNTDAAIMSLEQQLIQSEDKMLELTDEVERLKMCLHSSENERGVTQRQEDKEMIDTLKQQVKIYKEDFEQERKDRERIQGNNDILRHRLQETNKQLAAAEAHQTARVHVSAHSSPVFVGSPANYGQPRKFVARGISRQPDWGYFDDPLPSEVEIDGLDETDGPPAGNRLESGTEPLQCPRCASEFSVEDHSVFMRHVGICLDQ